MDKESSGIFNPPVSNDNEANPNGTVAPNDVQEVQPVEPQGAGAPEPVDTVAGSTDIKDALEIDATYQGDAAPASTDDQGYLDTGERHKSAEEPVLEPEEENLAPSWANNQPAEELGSSTGGAQEVILDEKRGFSNKKGEGGGENGEKELIDESCEKCIGNAVKALANYSQNGLRSKNEGLFVKSNLERISTGIDGSIELVNRMLRGELVDVRGEIAGNGIVTIGEFGRNDFETREVFSLAFSIGVTKEYAAEHPEVLIGVMNKVSESYPEYTQDEVFKEATQLIIRRKLDSRQYNDAPVLVASGLEEIAKRAEDAARENFQERLAQQEAAAIKMEEINRIVSSWGVGEEQN